MIYLYKNLANTVILELTLESSLINPFYLFEFSNDLNPSNVSYFTGTDLSQFKCRYNRFTIIETGVTYTNLTAATLNLLTGSYNYNIYEATGLTLSVSGTTGRVVNTGKVIVTGVDTQLPDIYR